MMIEFPEPGCTTGGCRCFPLRSVVDKGIFIEERSVVIGERQIEFTLYNNLAFDNIYYTRRGVDE